MTPILNLLTKKQESLQCYIVNSRPAILMTYCHDFFHSYHKEVIKLLPKKKNSYLFFLNKQYKSKIAILELKEQLDTIQKMNENIHYTFFANSEEENSNLIKFGLESIFCNKNCFLDEDNYKINPKTSKKYDAIYISRIAPVKRHLLAAKIKNLLLVGSVDEKEKEYAAKVKEKLKQAKWQQNLSTNALSKCINQAKVGLALSDVEGSMFGSTEYLLCGIPQVSTPSVGGRDVFFQDEYVKIVSANEDDIAAGVLEMTKCKTDPYKIRYETLKIMKQHRQTFMDYVQSIYDKENKRRIFENQWQDIFTHKMGLGIEVPKKIYNERILKPNMKI